MKQGRTHAPQQALTATWQPVAGSLATAVGNAHTQWTERRGIWLRLSDEQGRVGQGEASPLPGYSPDNLAQVERALARWAGTPLPEFDPQTPLHPQLRAALMGLEGVPAAQFAVETALLDWWGQRQEQPLPQLLGAPANAAPVPLQVLLSAEPKTALLQAERAVLRGIRQLKLKIGRRDDFAQELRLLSDLRQGLGPEIALRLDANGAFTLGELPARLAALAPHAPELIEEPLNPADLWALVADPRQARALAQLGVPWALDETLQQRGALGRLQPLAECGLVRSIVLKPMALGGALAAFELARQAAAWGLTACVTHLFDGPVALAAASGLALALPGPRRAAGLDRHPGLTAWPAVELPMLEPAAIATWTTPGLGLEVLKLHG